MAVNILCDFNEEVYSGGVAEVSVTLSADSRTGGDCLKTWSATGTNYYDDSISHSSAYTYYFYNHLISDRGTSKWKFWSDDEPNQYFYVTLIKKTSSASTESGTTESDTNKRYILRLNSGDTEISCCSSAYSFTLDAYYYDEGDSGGTTVSGIPLSAVDVTYSENNGLSFESSSATLENTLSYEFKINKNCVKGGDEVDNIVYFTLKDDDDVYAAYDLVQRSFDERVEMSADTYVQVIDASATTATFDGVSYFRRYYCVSDESSEQDFDNLDISDNVEFKKVYGGFDKDRIEDNGNTIPQRYTLTLTGTPNQSQTSITKNAVAMQSKDGQIGQVFEVIQRYSGDTIARLTDGLTLKYSGDTDNDGASLRGGVSLRITLASSGSWWSEDVVLGSTPYSSGNSNTQKYSPIIYDEYSVRINSIYVSAATGWHVLGETDENGLTYMSSAYTVYSTSSGGSDPGNLPSAVTENSAIASGIVATPQTTVVILDKPSSIDGVVNPSYNTVSDAGEITISSAATKNITILITKMAPR